MLEFHLQPGPLLPIGEPFGFGNAMAQVLLLLLQLMQVLELLPFQLPTVLEFLQAIEGLRAPLLLLDPFLQGACSAANRASSTLCNSASACSTRAGFEVASIFNSAAASSIKSMALSGRHRSLM